MVAFAAMNARDVDSLAKLRHSLDLSVREAARGSGLARQTIKDMEDGAGRASTRERYRRFLEALAVEKGEELMAVTGITASGGVEHVALRNGIDHTGGTSKEDPASTLRQTAYHEYATLRARLTDEQQRDVAEFESQAFARLAFIADPAERQLAAVSNAIIYVKRLLAVPDGATTDVEPE